MPIISIVNQKGGVAKTTTTANLGACLAMMGQKTLVIDMDPQANLTLGLGCVEPKLPYGLDEALMNPDSAPLRRTLQHVGDIPLYLAPGSIAMAHAEKMLTPIVGSAYRLRRALDALLKEIEFDWVLIDCPPSLGRLTEIAVIASNYLLIPTEPKFYSFAGMDTLNRMIVQMNQDLDLNVQLLGVLLTLYERNTKLHRYIAAEIRERFGDRMFDTVIPKNLRLSEAEVEGKPIILYDTHASGAVAYTALAEEVIKRVGGKK
jgi:chromosome partitioning protein